MTAHVSSAASIYRRVLQQVRPFWSLIGLIILLNLLATPLALLAPLPMKIAVDSVVGQKPMPWIVAGLLPVDWLASPSDHVAGLLALAVGLLLGVNLLTYLNGLGIWLLQTYTGEKLVLAFRSRLFRHVQRLSLSYHDRQGASDSVYRIQYDAPAIQWVSIDGVIPFAGAALTIASMIYVMALLDWQLAFLAMGVVPLLVVVTRLAGKQLRHQWDQVRQVESSAMSVVQETLSALRVVKAFGREEHEQSRFEDRAGQGLKGQLRVAMIRGGFDLLSGLTLALGTAGVLYLGVSHVLEGRLSLGNLLVVLAYLTQLYGPLQLVTKKITDLQGSLASAARAFALIDQTPDVQEKPHARAISRARGAIELKNVAFAYPDGHAVFSGVNLTVPAGSRVGIVGQTGSGKTTLISLLMRFYDPTEGAVLLDGVDLRDLKLNDLRNQYSIVLQEPVLFSSSIAQNIAYARPNATRQQIEAAACAAQAQAFISRQEQGYETNVGDRGMRLSGGERQRISIARAFLKDAPILVLDEPTSSVDTQTEAGIIQAMDQLMKDRTTFIIAHRLNTLANCDIIWRVQGGTVEVQLPQPLRPTASAGDFINP